MSVGSGDIVRVDVRGVINSAAATQNVFQLRNDGAAVDEADVVDDMVEILEALYVLLNLVLSTLHVIRDLRVSNISDHTDVGIGFFVDDTPGTNASTFFNQTASGLSIDTARLGVFGRKFFGPIPTSSIVNGGILGAPALAAVADVGDEMVALQVATNSNWRMGVIASADEVFLPFTGYGISPTAVTQRRRRIGVGI